MRTSILKAIFFNIRKILGLGIFLSQSWFVLTGLVLLVISQSANAGLSAKAELSSERVFRGVAQTDNNPAPSFKVQYNSENGLYLGTLLSRSDFRTRTIHSREYAYFLGYGTEINRNLSIDFSYINYDYQRPSLGPSRDWRELHLRIGIADKTALILGLSDDWFGQGTRTGQIEISQIYPLTADLNLQGTVGAILASSNREDYLYAELGIIYGLNKSTYIRADLNATNSGAKKMFGDRADTDVRISLGYIF